MSNRQQVSLQKKEYLVHMLETGALRLNEAVTDETVIKILETVATVCVNQANNIRRKSKALNEVEHME